MKSLLSGLAAIALVLALSPALHAQSSRTISGRVTAIDPGQKTVTIQTDQGAQTIVLTNNIDQAALGSIHVGDRVTATGPQVPTRPNIITGQSIALERAGTATAAPSSSGLQLLSGQVLANDQSNHTLTLKTTDGRDVLVMTNQVDPSTLERVHRGDHVSVVATPQPGHPDLVNAQLVDVTGAPGAQASAGTEQWHRVHGRVLSKKGSQLTFRSDDGRTLNVDMSAVGQNIQQALEPGEGAELVGFENGGPNQFEARYVQQDRPPSASPASR